MKDSRGIRAYHFVLSTLWNSDKFSGRSEWIPSQFSVLSNCGSRTVTNWIGRQVPRKKCGSSSDDQATNLMHELGHNLGLFHGGAPSPYGHDPLEGSDLLSQYKPNYFSVMNYSYSKAGVPGIGITYSQWSGSDINILDERSLAERDGVNSRNASNPLPRKTILTWYCPDSGEAKTARVNTPIDWNCKNGVQSRRVAGNIDYPELIRGADTPPENAEQVILHSHSDWSALLYAAGSIGRPDLIIPGVHDNFTEPTPKERAAAGALLEPRYKMPTPTASRLKSKDVVVKAQFTAGSEATLTYAVVGADGQERVERLIATVQGEQDSVVNWTVSAGELRDAIGIAVHMESVSWLESALVTI